MRVQRKNFKKETPCEAFTFWLWNNKQGKLTELKQFQNWKKCKIKKCKIKNCKIKKCKKVIIKKVKNIELLCVTC